MEQQTPPQLPPIIQQQVSLEQPLSQTASSNYEKLASQLLEKYKKAVDEIRNSSSEHKQTIDQRIAPLQERLEKLEVKVLTAQTKTKQSQPQEASEESKQNYHALIQGINESCKQKKQQALQLKKQLEDTNQSFLQYKKATDQRIATLEQNNGFAVAERIGNQNSPDSGATFMKYVAMAGFLALFIGTVATSAKITAIINHVLNQKIGL